MIFGVAGLRTLPASPPPRFSTSESYTSQARCGAQLSACVNRRLSHISHQPGHQSALVLKYIPSLIPHWPLHPASRPDHFIMDSEYTLASSIWKDLEPIQRAADLRHQFRGRVSPFDDVPQGDFRGPRDSLSPRCSFAQV